MVTFEQGIGSVRAVSAGLVSSRGSRLTVVLTVDLFTGDSVEVSSSRPGGGVFADELKLAFAAAAELRRQARSMALDSILELPEA